MIKAVIFDMDGLLIDSEPLWSRADKGAYKTINVQITDEDMLEVMGKTQPESAAHFFDKYQITGHSIEEIEALVLSNMIAMIKNEGKLLPGVHHAFEVCQQANLPMAIASSSSQEIIDAVVDTLGIREFFDHIHSAQYEEFGKPHPAVFISAAGLLGVKPEECLVFEDSPAGVLAAKAARMKCVAVPELHAANHSFVKTADVFLDSLEDFTPEILRSL